jgi:hypothetical protein
VPRQPKRDVPASQAPVPKPSFTMSRRVVNFDCA